MTATCRKWSNQTSLLPRGFHWGSSLQHKEASAKEREIKRNLCDLLRRQNSVAETKIFTKILQYTRSDLSLPCVASLRSKRFRLVLEERKTEERDFWFWPIFRTVFDSRSETTRKRLLRRLRLAASVIYTSVTFVSRLKFMIIVPSMERWVLSYIQMSIWSIAGQEWFVSK